MFWLIRARTAVSCTRSASSNLCATRRLLGITLDHIAQFEKLGISFGHSVYLGHMLLGLWLSPHAIEVFAGAPPNAVSDIGAPHATIDTRGEEAWLVSHGFISRLR